jgi:hypothetical protein
MMEFLEHPAAGNIIALAAFVFSVLSAIGAGISIWRTRNSRQITDQLNVLMLERAQREASESQQAELGANFISIGSDKTRLRIFNRGKAPAYDVRLEFPDGYDPVEKNDVDTKFPMAILEKHQNVDLLCACHWGSPSKLKVKFFWKSPEGILQEKITEPTR